MKCINQYNIYAYYWNHYYTNVCHVSAGFPLIKPCKAAKTVVYCACTTLCTLALH